MSQLLCLCFWFVQRVCQSGMVETRLGVLEDVISPKLIDLSSITLQRMPERRKICPKNPLWHIKTILMDYSINPYNKEQEEGKFQLTIFYSIPWNFWMRYVLIFGFHKFSFATAGMYELPSFLRKSWESYLLRSIEYQMPGSKLLEMRFLNG